MKELIKSTLEVKLQENQTGDASRFLGPYILSYCMYMCVSDLPILSRAGIIRMMVAEWKRSINMCDAHVCGSIAIHAQHGNELSRVKLGLIEQGSP